MSRIEHHPSEETVYSYAAGALPAALALVVGCHLQYCPQCRALAAQGEALGGDLLASLDEKPLSQGRRESMMALLDASPAQKVEEPAPRKVAIEVPGLLRNLVGHDDFDSLPWKSIVPGMKQVDLKLGEGEAKLLRIAAGKKMPVHSHQGNELTLILRGGYSDSLGKFNAGDFAELDGSVEHQPIADADEDCICLAGMDAPLAFKGLIAKMLQPIFKI
ncbi:ChrR family anti-sigma-E factor [Spongiibacter tropicus]|uniref:ChrR family anti-sigma-E factor n=1 Tax=Spongiibacter tropicus TaxID=454602 RepID=UPI002356551A|nr:ChrR family anti-sigma-E factor [Spongiibacter tropicus]|tara:strand:- start:13348 stop:14001 length:654 start_codon:yes stop_codon:yes gene_type:complete